MNVENEYKCSTCGEKVKVLSVNFYDDELPRSFGIEYECSACGEEVEDYYQQPLAQGVAEAHCLTAKK